MGVSEMAAQSSHDTLRTVLAMLTLAVACVYWSVEIYLGTKFSDELLRNSALELVPALGSLFVSIAVLIAPLRFAWQPRLVAIFSLAQVLVLVLFAVGAVFIVPAIALQEWQTTYSNEEYAKSLHPQWLALPIAAAAYRIIRRRSNAARTNNAV